MGDHFGTGGYYFQQQSPADFIIADNQITIDDLLLDFHNEEDVIMNGAFFDGFNDFSSSNSSLSGSEAQFSGSGGELYVPCDELPELEWLSSFNEESFSSDDGLNNLQFISSANKLVPATATSSVKLEPKTEGPNYRMTSPFFHNDVLVPGKVRSKRSRTAPCDWSSRLVLLKLSKTDSSKRPSTDSLESLVRRCMHCGSDKTPQWRRGPMGPKTLCNACGVRHKSGRLVPEYRPAASPSFVPAKHSNSHRKVMELRRQQELLNHSSSSVERCHDYLLHVKLGQT